jgi:hypothetical protein
VNITFQYFNDCPNWHTTYERLQEAIGERNDIDIIMQCVSSPDEAEAVRFGGSPTVLVDGVDPFAEGAPPAGTLACRVYQTEDGSPSVDQLRDAVRTG